MREDDIGLRERETKDVSGPDADSAPATRSVSYPRGRGALPEFTLLLALFITFRLFTGFL